MKINISKALMGLFLANLFVVHLKASESQSSCVAGSLVMQSQSNKNVVQEEALASLVQKVRSAHEDQIQFLDKLNINTSRIFAAVKQIQQAKLVPAPLLVQYVPVYGNNGVEYIPSGPAIRPHDPMVIEYGKIVDDNFECVDKEVTQKKPFLAHARNTIALFENTHDKMCEAMSACDDEQLIESCQEYFSLIDMQKKWVNNQIEKQVEKEKAVLEQQIAQQEVERKLIRKQEKKEKHKLKIAQQKMAQEAAVQEKARSIVERTLQELAVEQKNVAEPLAQEAPVSHESKALINTETESKSENKLQEIKENKRSLPCKKKTKKDKDLESLKNKDIESLQKFMTHTTKLIETKNSLAVIEQRLKYAQNESRAIFLDDADQAALDANSVEPMQRHLNELKKTKEHDENFKKAQAKLGNASEELIGQLGYLAKTKWEILTGKTEDTSGSR